MPFRVIAAVALIAVVATSCGDDRPGVAPTQPSTTISALARNYIEELIRILETHSINRSTIDWARFRNDV